VDLGTGQVLEKSDLQPQYFGEGLTLFNENLLQLTWQTQTGFIYDQATLRPIRTFSYSGEGWGLTNDGHQIFMSDGTPQLRYFDPATLQETGRMTVHDGRGQVVALNELEYVRGTIYANVFQSDWVAQISPVNGQVVGWVDLSGLLTPDEQAQADVLNGIAYDTGGNRLFVTGKLWPKLFEIQLVRRGT
jgi:glutamine cyclotransferase